MECGKHDCFIVSSEGEVLAGVFTIPNNMDGFHCLLQKIRECTNTQDKIKVGLEATGHYSYNLLGFLLDNGLATYVLNASTAFATTWVLMPAGSRNTLDSFAISSSSSF